MSKNKAMATVVAKDSGHPKSEYEKQAKRIGFDVRDFEGCDGRTPEYRQHHRDLYLQGKIFQGGFNIKYLSSLVKINDEDAARLKNFALESQDDEFKKKVFTTTLASISKKEFKYEEFTVRRLLERKGVEPRYREQAKKIGFYADSGADLGHKHLYLIKDGEEYDKSSAPFFENVSMQSLVSLEKLDKEAIARVTVLAGECQSGVYKKEDFLKLLHLINVHKKASIGKDEIDRLITEIPEHKFSKKRPRGKTLDGGESDCDAFPDAAEICRALGCSLSKIDDFSPSNESYILQDFSAKEDSPPHILTKDQLLLIIEYKDLLQKEGCELSAQEIVGSILLLDFSDTLESVNSIFNVYSQDPGLTYEKCSPSSSPDSGLDPKVGGEMAEGELVPSGDVFSPEAKTVSFGSKRRRAY